MEFCLKFGLSNFVVVSCFILLFPCSYFFPLCLAVFDQMGSLVLSLLGNIVRNEETSFRAALHLLQNNPPDALALLPVTGGIHRVESY